MTKRSLLFWAGLAVGTAGLATVWVARPRSVLTCTGPGLATAQTLAQQALDRGDLDPGPGGPMRTALRGKGTVTLTSIRTKQTTPRATLCFADLHIVYQNPPDTADIPAAYTIELTDNGTQLYVTLGPGA